MSDSLQRAQTIEVLELRLFDALKSTMAVDEAMRVSINYFDKCEPQVLTDLLTMPSEFWREEAEEIKERMLPG